MYVLEVPSKMKTRMFTFEIIINAINKADYQKGKCQERRRIIKKWEACKITTAARPDRSEQQRKSA